MKRSVVLIVLLFAACLGGTAWGVPRILRTFQWNNRQYSVVLMEDGSTSEIKGVLGEKSSEVLAKVQKLVQAQTDVKDIDIPGPLLSQATTEQIKTEIAKRKLTAKDLGLEVVK